MYERSAIVLERYLNSVFGYSSEYNLKTNFENYCNLVSCLEDFQIAYTKEQIAIQNFNNVTESIRNLQKSQEKLYKKSAKLEYSRNLLFNNVEEVPEQIEKCIKKLEDDIDKNSKTQIDLREKFVDYVKQYIEKKEQLENSKQARKDAENHYNEVYALTKTNAENINEFNLEFAKNFTGTQIKEKLTGLMIDNGKLEKVPFDTTVIDNVADVSLDIAKREVECYIDMYENLMRLFDEISKNCIRLEKFKKRMRNTKVKLNFLFAEKEYIVQFLDYERITSVNGKRAHKKLMNEACENFQLDVKQINNLYELILREIATKSTKKGYKELYNKSYLLEIKETEEKFKKERNKVNLDAGTILNSNYWRIEGIKNIYTVFYKDVSEQFGKDLDEFDIPQDDTEESGDEVDIFEKSSADISEVTAIVPELEIEEEIEEKDPIAKVEQEKVNMFENAMVGTDEDDDDQEEIKENIITEDEKIDEFENAKEEIKEISNQENFTEEEQTSDEKQSSEEFDIFAKNYTNIESQLDEIDKIDEQEVDIETKTINTSKEKDIVTKNKKKKINVFENEDEIAYEDEEDFLEEDDLEESLFGNIKNVKTRRKSKEDEKTEDLMKTNNSKNKKGIFKSLMKMNSKSTKKKVTE